MAEETTPNPTPEEATPSEKATPETAKAAPKAKTPPKAEAGAEAKPAAKPAAKKEKPPALEDQPFAEFIQQHYVPGLEAGLSEQGIRSVSLTFAKQPIPIAGYAEAPECWQVAGRWLVEGNQLRAFNIYFFDEDIKGKKGFSCSESGNKPSTLESFLIDERRVDLSLLVDRTLQRLNAQKWLVRN